MPARSALLINCSRREAARISEQAGIQRRSVSGYILNIVIRAVEFDEAFVVRHAGLVPIDREPPGVQAAPRATLLARCSTTEASRIRAVAREQNMTISGFVLHCLRRSWKVSEDLAAVSAHSKN